MNWLGLLELRLELRRWRRLGLTPRLVWRDDDAREATARLDTLIAMAAGRPFALAIVPDGDSAGLAARLRTVPSVSVSQHGVDHVDRSRAGEAPSEFLADMTEAAIAEAIGAARRRMEAAGLAPIFFTPPWNRIDSRLSRAVRLAGFAAVSAASAAPAAEGQLRLDCDLDILRWKGSPRFRGHGRILRSLTRQLRRRRISGDFDEPIGLLTHHLVHDAQAWAFLSRFLSFADASFAWLSFDDFARGRGAIAAD